MHDDIKIGDRVICTTGVAGIVIDQYTPTASAHQTMIATYDGRRYHAPTDMFRKAQEDKDQEHWIKEWLKKH